MAQGGFNLERDLGIDCSSGVCNQDTPAEDLIMNLPICISLLVSGKALATPYLEKTLKEH